MTRINLIPVDELADQHLMAEYRELPMIHGSLKRTLKSQKGLQLSRISPVYTLNTGHVYFFYDKGFFLLKRYKLLIRELRKRGYRIRPQDREVDWNIFIKNKLFRDWKPSSAEIEISRARIIQRLHENPGFYTRYGSLLSES